MLNIPKNLNIQDQATRSIISHDGTYFEGEWNFRGYTPQGCDEPGDCFVHTLGFNLETTHRRDDWHCFNTFAAKEGPKCKEIDKTLRFLGFSWMHGNLMAWGGGNGMTP